MVTVTIKNENGRFVVSSKESESTIVDMLDLFGRVLLAAGYVFDGKLDIVSEDV